MRLELTLSHDADLISFREYSSCVPATQLLFLSSFAGILSGYSLQLKHVLLTVGFGTDCSFCSQWTAVIWEMQQREACWRTLARRPTVSGASVLPFTGSTALNGADSHSWYSVTASIFYATYVTFEPFFTTILKTVKPSILLPTVVVVWGAM